MTERQKTHPGIRGVTPELQSQAKWRRENMTPEERILWQAIRLKQLDGLRFRAQHPVGTFILDFWCPERRLVIEVDGGVHDDRQEHDALRTKRLQEYGYRVLRVRNEEIYGNLAAVLDRIRRAAFDE